MIERVDTLANELVGEAFCADWHDDPDKGVREIDRIKSMFLTRLYEFARDEIKRDRAARIPVVAGTSAVSPSPQGSDKLCLSGCHP